MPDSLLPPGTTAWILSDGKIGDEVQCFGLAEALGVIPERRLVCPRAPWSWFIPFGPIDPKDAPRKPGSPIAPPFPDIVIASGRRTVSYLRAVKRASQGRAFTVFIKDPYTGTRAADLICIHAHDRLRGDNVFVSVTPSNRLSGAVLAAASAAPDPRIATLPRPRLALILGGKSGSYDFSADDAGRLAAIAMRHAQEGYSLMVTPSRRTPGFVTEAIRAALAATGKPAFVWDGAGSNPYVHILGSADALLVTADSVNMLGEAVTTGKPVMIYEPARGGHRKMTAYVDALTGLGAARRYRGTIETFSYVPIESTPAMAREAARRYRDFRLKHPG